MALLSASQSYYLRSPGPASYGTVALPLDEFASLGPAVSFIDEDRYPLSPRLDPLKSALAKLDPAHAQKPRLDPKPPLPEAPTRSRGGRRARR